MNESLVDAKKRAALSDEEFREQVAEEVGAFDKLLEEVKGEVAEFRGLMKEFREIKAALGLHKKTRLTALENKTEEEITEETGETTIGDSHDDFIGFLKRNGRKVPA